MNEMSLAEQALGKKPVERKTHEEIVEIARGMVTNTLWGTSNVEMIRTCFLPVMLGGALPETGFVYAPIEEASERTVNGLPTFFSCRFMHFEDVPDLFEEINRMCAALGQEPLCPPDDEMRGAIPVVREMFDEEYRRIIAEQEASDAAEA